jgi:surface antigen
MALQLIQNQSASLTVADVTYYHTQCTSLAAMEHEQATTFLKRFNNAKIQSQAAGDVYTEEQILDIFLETM